MVEEFIEANNLTALVHNGAVQNDFSARCMLFLDRSSNAFLVVLPKKGFLNKESLSKAIGVKDSDLRKAGDEDAFDITGYSGKFLPPVSIYGVTLVLDKKVRSWQKAFFLLEGEKTLEISVEEIIENNEDSVEAEVAD